MEFKLLSLFIAQILIRSSFIGSLFRFFFYLLMKQPMILDHDPGSKNDLCHNFYWSGSWKWHDLLVIFFWSGSKNCVFFLIWIKKTLYLFLSGSKNRFFLFGPGSKNTQIWIKDHQIKKRSTVLIHDLPTVTLRRGSSHLPQHGTSGL